MTQNQHADDQRARPLEGIKIVEVGVWHAGPGASAILGDLGAEVIKIESLTGDPERLYGTFRGMPVIESGIPDWTLLFEITNRNKKGICVDIATEQGQAILRALIQRADVFVTNLRQSTRPKLGIDYPSVSKVNTRIIYANVSAFGPKGPMSDTGGFDPLGQAISGMTFLAGREEPIVLQTIILDQLTAITASHAIVTALLVRERQGIAQEVEVSLYGTATWLLHANLVSTSLAKQNTRVAWDRSKNPPLRNTYKCRDGKWIMGADHKEHKYWHPFCQTIGREELATDPRFATPELRNTNLPTLICLLDEIFVTRTQQDWLESLRGAGLLFVPIQELPDVLQHPQALINGYVVDYEHRALGKIRIPGYPVRFGANKAGTHGPAPGLGEHTHEVLAELGYVDRDIEQLKTAKVIR
ncbi:MAG TPA: CoA transferase [Steroidobacteraceae bacterium]|jgi:crotonobetainyl-CoA:carnitine CoA-transferase CaiB-like acyl-CoA transferase